MFKQGFSALRATASQTHVGEHETIPVHVSNPASARKLGDKMKMVREKLGERAKRNSPEKITPDFNGEGSDGGMYQGEGSSFDEAEIAKSVMGSDNEQSFMGHKGLGLTSVEGNVSRHRAHAHVPFHAVHKSLTDAGYHRYNKISVGTGTVHEYKHPENGDKVGVIADGNKPDSPVRRTNHNTNRSEAPVKKGTGVHASYHDGMVYPANYVKKNDDGSHTVKWKDGGAEETVHHFYPNHAYKHHPEMSAVQILEALTAGYVAKENRG